MINDFHSFTNGSKCFGIRWRFLRDQTVVFFIRCGTTGWPSNNIYIIIQANSNPSQSWIVRNFFSVRSVQAGKTRFICVFAFCNVDGKITVWLSVWVRNDLANCCSDDKTKTTSSSTYNILDGVVLRVHKLDSFGRDDFNATPANAALTRIHIRSILGVICVAFDFEQ